MRNCALGCRDGQVRRRQTSGPAGLLPTIYASPNSTRKENQVAPTTDVMAEIMVASRHRLSFLFALLRTRDIPPKRHRSHHVGAVALLIDFRLDELCQVSQRLLPTEIASLQRNGIWQALLHNI